MTDTLKFSCPCHFGLESVLAFEVKKIGGQNVVLDNGKVTFTGDYNLLARANICLSTAERVLIELSSFTATSFEELFQGVKKIPLEDFIGKSDAFPVKGYSLNSALYSIPDCQAIIKKASVERLKETYHLNWFEETGPVHQMQFSIMNDVATIYLDTSGAGLHKRGYRRNANLAPIKETLAAGIIDLARVRSGSIVCDPFCGSGTFIIESAFKALNIAPCLNRHFAAEQWGCISPSVWKEERNGAIERVDRNAEFHGYGYDIDADAIDLSIDNSKKASIKSRVLFNQADITQYNPPEGAITICNPPYGERMLEIKEAEKIYTSMGHSIDKPCYIISPHEDFEGFFGKRADKRRKLYNGMIKCQVFMYFK